MSVTFDATTTSEYADATTAVSRSAIIVAALTGTISVKVFDGSNVEKGSGTMTAPWATSSGGTVTVGEVSSFTVGATGTPDANWYIRFQNAGVTRWVRGSFGLLNSGQDFYWSLDNWTATHTGTIGTATITTSGNAAPAFTIAPTTANLPSTGGTLQFTAVDPEGSTVVYSLTTTRSGITINASTGEVTVTSAAVSTSGNIVVQASDGILSTTTTCLVTVANQTSASVKYYPGHYALNGAGDSAAGRASLWAEVAASGGWTGGHVRYYWGNLESSLGVYDFSIIDDDLNTMAGLGLKMVLQILTTRFGTQNPASLVPSYLRSPTYNDGVAFLVVRNRVVIQLWNAAVVDRIIALDAAFAARYEDHPSFAGVVISETALGNRNEIEPYGYTTAGFVTQIKRRVLASETEWPTTPHFVYYNYLDTTNPTGADLAQYCLAHNCGLGGPDIFPNNPTEGQEVYMGLQGGVDYRGVLPVCYANQTEINDYAIADLYAYGKNTLRCGYMNTQMTPDGDPNTRTGIKNFVAANPLMHVAVPTIYL